MMPADFSKLASEDKNKIYLQVQSPLYILSKSSFNSASKKIHPKKNQIAYWFCQAF